MHMYRFSPSPAATALAQESKRTWPACSVKHISSGEDAPATNMKEEPLLFVRKVMASQPNENAMATPMTPQAETMFTGEGFYCFPQQGNAALARLDCSCEQDKQALGRTVSQ